MTSIRCGVPKLKLTALLASRAACRDVLSLYGCYWQSEAVWADAPSDTASSADQVLCTSNTERKKDRIKIST